MEAHELLRIVGLKMDRSEEDMVLAVVSHTGGTQRHGLQKTQKFKSSILVPSGHTWPASVGDLFSL